MSEIRGKETDSDNVRDITAIIFMDINRRFSSALDWLVTVILKDDFKYKGKTENNYIWFRNFFS